MLKAKEYQDSHLSIWWQTHAQSHSIYLVLFFNMTLPPGGASGKEPTSHCRRHKRRGFNPWVGKIPWRRAGQTTPVFLPGEHPMEQGAFAGYDAWGCEELDTPEAT